MRWLTNFYDFRFKGKATAGIGIHPTKAWLSQLVNFKLTGMWDRRFSLWVSSKAQRGKQVDSLDWFDLNHHFRGVFPFLEHLWVHLFCFSFHVGECMLALRWTRAQIKIYIFISSRLLGTYLSFRFILIFLCDQAGQETPLFSKFSLFVNYH